MSRKATLILGPANGVGFRRSRESKLRFRLSVRLGLSCTVALLSGIKIGLGFDGPAVGSLEIRINMYGIYMCVWAHDSGLHLVPQDPQPKTGVSVG